MTLQNTSGSIVEIVRNDRAIYDGDLIHYFRVLVKKARNLQNPYHNFRHLGHVMWLCYRACEYYADKLTMRERRALLIAALLHDFDHTGKSVPDSENIARAVMGLVENLLPEDQDIFFEIVRIIKATEYPYTVPESDLNLPCMIIRDADMSQSFSVAWIQQTIFGLSEEWGKPPLEVLKIQKPFHEKLRFLTDWARKEFPQEVIDRKIAEAEELVNLLSDPAVPAA
jgi:hypothetical protein